MALTLSNADIIDIDTTDFLVNFHNIDDNLHVIYKIWPE